MITPINPDGNVDSLQELLDAILMSRHAFQEKYPNNHTKDDTRSFIVERLARGIRKEKAALSPKPSGGDADIRRRAALAWFSAMAIGHQDNVPGHIATIKAALTPAPIDVDALIRVVPYPAEDEKQYSNCALANERVRGYNEAVNNLARCGHLQTPVPGWKLVPVEPDAVMLECGFMELQDPTKGHDEIRRIYKAMLCNAEATPPATERTGDE